MERGDQWRALLERAKAVAMGPAYAKLRADIEAALRDRPA